MEANTPAAQDTTAPARDQEQETPAASAVTDAPGDPLDAILQAEAASDAEDDVESGLLGGQTPPDENGPEPDQPDKEPTAAAYEPFVLPEGFMEDKEVLDNFGALAAKHGLKQDQAQEFVSMYAEMEQRKSADQAKFLADNNATWLREVKTNAEFGGANLKASTEAVQATLRRYGSLKLLAEVQQMNLQNWPEMFYLLARVQRATAEDRSPGGEGGVRELTADDYFSK